MALPSWIEDLLFGPLIYASPFGNDDNPGTFALPKRTVAAGLAALPKKGGGRLHLRGGTYVENVLVSGFCGLSWRPLVIRSHPGEEASIDGTVAEFREAGNQEWTPVPGQPDEFISSVTYPQTTTDDADEVKRGAFMDRVPYTRLVTYSQLEDLRAVGTTFDKLWTGEGPTVVRCPKPDEPGEDEDTPDEPSLGRRPRVYMGPGIYFDAVSRKVHIRLSHTSNEIDDLADYKGETDPRNLRLALSAHADTALTVEKSANVKITDVMLRFGGESTVRVRNSLDIVFDHVRIMAASRGIRLGEVNTNTVFQHCEVRGGWPTWLFRSDRKDEYCFRENGKVVTNELGKHTSSAILSGTGANTGTHVHHCEFSDGHDLYLFGTGMRFHHNWVHNFNDDALALNAVATVDARVWQNVFTQCLMAISYGAKHDVSGQCAVFRNLIDLRRPTAGIRPQRDGDKDVWRQGAFYKSNNADGPLDLFHNTAITLVAGAIMPSGREPTKAAFNHYRHRGTARLRSFNNIFVAITPQEYAHLDKYVAYLPGALPPGPTNGNCYFRSGHEPPWNEPMFSINHPSQEYDSLEGYLGSQEHQAGFEDDGTDQKPPFYSFHFDGTLDDEHDDLRLTDGNPHHQAVQLPDDLDEMDPLSLSWIPEFARPKQDMGCYGYFAAPLAVGVNGRHRYPPPPTT